MRLAAILGAVLTLLVAAASFASTARTRVWLADQAPARVAGSGFKAGERVSVVLRAGKARLGKTVSATSSGRITAAWTRSIAGGCRTTTISATGAQGSRAFYREVANDCTGSR